ncbi:MAG: hypothetical protein IIA87_00960 [Nanoarchaeota archaeon]|nr:hypothetical protein [Nanoarchaeota archaeon]
MTIRNLIGGVEDLIPVNNVLISVYDKTGLDRLIPGLVELNPGVRFLLTGGTHRVVGKILEGLRLNGWELIEEISEYTGFPEMEGGLVKTLHPKIHAGLLAERNNPDHRRFLEEELCGGVFIDVAVVNLYPFSEVVSSGDVDFERARGHIDIGGPAMIRAAAKNFPSCAAVCDPRDYSDFLMHLISNTGATSFIQRVGLAGKAFEMTARYDREIANYFAKNNIRAEEDIRREYGFADGGDD